MNRAAVDTIKPRLQAAGYVVGQRFDGGRGYVLSVAVNGRPVEIPTLTAAQNLLRARKAAAR